jgi:hypothetical protein
MRLALVLLVVTVGFFSAPLYSAPTDAGEVVGSDIFDQTLQVKMHSGQVETVPFQSGRTSSKYRLNHG